MLRSQRGLVLAGVAALVLGLLAPVPGHAASVKKSVALEFDKWYDVDLQDGPVTLHRIRFERKHESMRAKLIRPGNTEPMQDVQVQFEFSNHDKEDWKALIRFSWMDADGKTIDSYSSEENLDDSSDHKGQTITVPTLAYGLDRAKTLAYEISIGR